MHTLTLVRRLVAGAAVCLLLVACSAGSDPGPAASPDAEPPAGFPVTIEHTFGEATIPQRPERVVAVGYTEQDAILAFGVVPVGVRYAFGPEDDAFFPWADEAAGDAQPVIMPRDELNFEQVAALEPDLIMAVTAGLEQGDYDLLAQIAPTVAQPAEYVAFGTPWQVQTEITGRALGEPERAAELIAEVETQIEAARAEYPQFEGLTLALSGPQFDGGYPFHTSADTRSRFFTDLGMQVPAELDAAATSEFYGTVSREQAGLLDRDVLIWQAGSAAERAAIEADPVLAALPVTTDGRALFIDGSDYDAIQFGSALSLPFLLESYLPKLAAAVG